MMAYASRTGTRRNLAALREAGWGLFVSAAGVHRNEGFPFVIDNGAWTSFSQGTPWDQAAFEAVLAKLGGDPLCEGIVAPDIVCGGAASLDLSMQWIERLLGIGPTVYLPVQPGIHPEAVRDIIGARVGVFIGGDAAWKEGTARFWADLAHDRGALCHMGRVNSQRRLAAAKVAGIDSIDGSGPSRFSKHLVVMEAGRRAAVQLGLAVTVLVDVHFEEDGTRWYAWVAVAEDAGIDTIVLAAGRLGIFEVQTDRGVWSYSSGWVWTAWEDFPEW